MTNLRIHNIDAPVEAKARRKSTTRRHRDVKAPARNPKTEANLALLKLPDGVELTRYPQNIRCNRKLSPDEFASVFRELSQLQENAQWWGARLWILGQKWGYGKRTELAKAGCFGHWSITTLKNMASVARKFEPSRVRDVSFAHHEAVASLSQEQADEWLDRAVKDRRLKSSDLREQVRLLKIDGLDPEFSEDTDARVSRLINAAQIDARLMLDRSWECPDVIDNLIRNPSEGRACIKAWRDLETFARNIKQSLQQKLGVAGIQGDTA